MNPGPAWTELIRRGLGTDEELLSLVENVRLRYGWVPHVSPASDQTGGTEMVWLGPGAVALTARRLMFAWVASRDRSASYSVTAVAGLGGFGESTSPWTDKPGPVMAALEAVLGIRDQDQSFTGTVFLPNGLAIAVVCGASEAGAVRSLLSEALTRLGTTGDSGALTAIDAKEAEDRRRQPQ